MPVDKNIKYSFANRERPHILVTNDDGVESDGIIKLAKALEGVGDVLIVAPAREQSAMSHTLSLRKPLYVERLGENFYAVDGTPTDCVSVAVNFILKGCRPDILFAGINRGANVGDDIHYSGTVSAAVEGGIFGIQSVAVSVTSHKPASFEPAAEFAVKVARQVLKKKLPKETILNVNVPNLPNGEINGYKITFQGKKRYSDITHERRDECGKKYYWIDGDDTGFEDVDGSDCDAVGRGYISVTPIRVNITSEGFLKKLKTWRF